MSGVHTRSIPELFRDSFTVYKRNPAPFWQVALVLVIPSLLFQFLMPESSRTPASTPVQMSGAQATIFLLLGVVAIYVVTIGYGAIVKLSSDAIAEKPLNPKDALASAVPRALPLIGANILITLAMMVGFILLIIPGIIVMCWYYVTYQTMIVEEKGVFDGMRRSRELAKGNIGRILTFLLAVMLAAFVLALALGILVALASLGLMALGSSAILIAILVGILMLALIPYLMILMTMFYYDLRARHNEFAEVVSTPPDYAFPSGPPMEPTT